MFTFQLVDREIPELFAKFEKIVSNHFWLDQEMVIGTEITRNPHLAEYLHEESELAIAMSNCTRHAALNGGKLPLTLTHEPEFYQAFQFAAQTLSLLEIAHRYSPKRARSLVRRVQCAFADPQAVRGMQLEARVATHFTSRGHFISWPELEGSKETFDILITSLGPIGLEIECKVITKDKGRQVHRREAIEFINMVEPPLRPFYQSLSCGLYAVVTLPTRMPSDLTTISELATRVAQQVVAGFSETFSDGVDIRIAEFEVKSLGALQRSTSKENRDAIERITGTQNREAALLVGPEGGVLMLVVQSVTNDSVLRNVFDTLGLAAQRQLTRKRPGSLIAGFQGLRPEQLFGIANNESDGTPSALARKASDFLSSEDLQHVVGVGFLSESNAHKSQDADSSQGIAYYFPKKTSPLWHEDFGGLFGADPRLKF